MATTLSTTKILNLTLKAFRKKVPQIKAFSTDFGSDQLRLGETAIAHVPTIPTVSDWDAGTGYGNGAQAARSLMVDVPVVVDQHKFVTLSWAHINNITDQKDSVEQMVGNAAYAIGKAMFDSVLAKLLAANVSRHLDVDVEAVDRQLLRDARKSMNLAGASNDGRVIIGNSDFIGNLSDDPRISSKDYSGQLTGAEAYAHYTNIEGFKDIWEYPDFPANGEGLMGIAAEPSGVAIRAGVPDHTFDLAQTLGIQTCAGHEIMSDPETGFTLLAINWQTPGTFALNLTLGAIWGSAVGKQGGAANAITDRALLRFVDV